jgi:uncharacterized protein (TIGR01777 family)
MKVLVTGATGLIGRALCRLLAGEGHQLVVLSRRSDKLRLAAPAELHQWDSQAGPPPAEALAGVEAVVHLAGEPVAGGRWTEERKRRIRDSRVIGTRNLVAGLRAMNPPPRVLINGSAVGFYGDRGDEQLTEQSAAGQGFLSEVCQQWEGEGARASEFGVRLVQVRTGVVLSAEDGALPRMLPAFKFGVAGELGSGRQWFPWIHIDDIAGIFHHALTTVALSGPVNGAAPESVTNARFTKELAAVLHRPAFLAVPEFVLKLLLGEMAEIVLASQRVMPQTALDSGYRFRHPRLKEALIELLAGNKQSTAAASRARAV